MKYYTDYPLHELGDVPGEMVPVRKVKLHKYYKDAGLVSVIYKGNTFVVDRNYIYYVDQRDTDLVVSETDLLNIPMEYPE